MADSDRHDDLDEEDRFEEEGRRSIFSALWFRAILVVVVLGVVAAVAVPYLLEWANPQPPQPPTASRPGGMSTPMAPPPAPVSPPPSAPSVTPPMTPPVAEKPEPAPPPAVAQEKPAAPTKEKPAASTRKPEPSRSVAAKEPTASRPAKASASGAYFVQVGAFKDPDAARRLAARLRELKFDVDESMLRGAPAPAAKAPAAPSPSAPTTGSDKYDVYVSGGVPAEINAKLAAKGLSAEQSSAGLVVKPSLPLRDAVALSKDLAVDGLKVQVRRSGGGSTAPAAAAPSAPAPSAPAPSGDTFYRVRVGPYDARADATSAMQELEKRGYKPFLARAGQ